MKVTGIIAEYNPFHNGHKYHIQKAKEMTGCDYTIVIMSGDYTQRGTPAIYSKYIRTKAALSAGADLVLEMPVFGSVASAPDFARCGVRSLSSSGVCDMLFFGSEVGSIEILEQQAFLQEQETPEISAKIRDGLRNGLSWPQARARAFALTANGEQTAAIADLPNDILGIEYIRAIRDSGSSITPVTLKRNDPGYHSEEKFGSFASATAARKAILEGNMDFLTEILPDELFDALPLEPCPPITFDDCSLLLGEKLLRSTLEELQTIAGMPAELASKLYKQRLQFETAQNLVAARKDRNYTYTRVNRSLLNLMLGITQHDSEQFKSLDSVPWLRILGFRKEAGPLLSEMKQKSSVPMLTKIAAAAAILSPESYELFQKHLQCAELYRLLVQLRSGQPVKNEFQRSVIIV